LATKSENKNINWQSILLMDENVTIVGGSAYFLSAEDF
jgi:hypothetical protein